MVGLKRVEITEQPLRAEACANGKKMSLLGERG